MLTTTRDNTSSLLPTVPDAFIDCCFSGHYSYPAAMAFVMPVRKGSRPSLMTMKYSLAPSAALSWPFMRSVFVFAQASQMQCLHFMQNSHFMRAKAKPGSVRRGTTPGWPTLPWQL